MGPLLAAMLPLEAVVVEMATEGDAWREGAVAEGRERAETWDLVYVADDEDVALRGGLGAGQGGQSLREEGVAGEAFVLPGITCGEG